MGQAATMADGSILLFGGQVQEELLDFFANLIKLITPSISNTFVFALCTFYLLDIWKELTRMLFNYRCSREKQPYAAHRAEVNSSNSH